MKILACAHSQQIAGGANRSFLMVVDGLRSRYNVEVEVMLPMREEETIQEASLPDALQKRGIPFFRAGLPTPREVFARDGLDPIRRARGFLKLLKRAASAVPVAWRLRNRGYDLVYTNTRFPLTGAVVARLLRIPHITHVREFTRVSDVETYDSWNEKRVCAFSNKVILISRALYDEYLSYSDACRLVHIPNAVDTPRSLPCHPHKRKEGALELLLTARIASQKGHLEAVYALHILWERGLTGIRLHFAGSTYGGNERYYDEIVETVCRLGLDDSVIFHGEIFDMVSLRAEMDVELVASWRETFGRVTVEGMCSGLVVIGSNAGGTAELIEDGVTGLLYERGNPMDLADKIQRVLEDAELFERLSETGYKYVQTRFLPEENVRRVYETMCEAVGQREAGEGSGYNGENHKTQGYNGENHKKHDAAASRGVKAGMENIAGIRPARRVYLLPAGDT